jgi:hypothetical protein
MAHSQEEAMIPIDLVVNAVIADRRRQADRERLARVAFARVRRRGTEPCSRLLIDLPKAVLTTARRAVGIGRA